MKPFEFLRKLASRYLLGNLIAMALVVVAVCLGVRYGLDIYTHHGEKIMIPDVRRKSFSDASYLLEDAKLKVVVSDTGYVPGLPPDCILEQTPRRHGRNTTLPPEPAGYRTSHKAKWRNCATAPARRCAVFIVNPEAQKWWIMLS